MKVFKFGGASVKSAEAVRNVAEIIGEYQNQKIVLVISAMGKITNALEKLLNLRSSEIDSSIADIERFHLDIINKLFSDSNSPIYPRINTAFEQLRKIIAADIENQQKRYASVVGFGELFSTIIVNQYLQYLGFKSIWVAAGDIITTENKCVDAEVIWDKSIQKIKSELHSLFVDNTIIVTQGFIAKTDNGDDSTLGREGSDYSAAIIANAIDAEDLTIWKDVPGLLNADPKYFDNTQKIDIISYRETIELAYYGASIIHPKTIQPLKKKTIPLYIKSFISPHESGTIVQQDAFADSLIPSYIFKKNQVIISISARDFSFIAEDKLSIIFDKLNQYNLKVNLMQNSAISFSICIDNKGETVHNFIIDMQKTFKVKYNDDIELITIQNYNQDVIDELIGNRDVFLEQKSRTTVQLLVR